MLALDPILSAAQSNKSRRPLVEITSQEKVADIPFNGQRLSAETFAEYAPAVTVHSSGRLCLAYTYGPDGTAPPDNDSGIKYVYTDTDRSQFNTVTIALSRSSASYVAGISVCELTGGNIGLVYLVNDLVNHKYRLMRRIVTAVGGAVSYAEIDNWSHDLFTSDPWVLAKASDDYLVVYGKVSGSDYRIYKRTSADFLAWSQEEVLSIGGLTPTWRLNNPSMIKLSTGEIWLWFDVLETTGPNGEELLNIYYSTSSDGALTWSNATKWTNYSTYSQVALHPVAVQKVADEIYALFTKQISALQMDASSTGWPSGRISSPSSIHFDPTNRKLYVTHIRAGSVLECVTRVDIDTWTIDDYWTNNTYPGFPDFFYNGSITWLEHRARASGCLIPLVWIYVSGGSGVSLLNGESDTIVNYYLETVAYLGITGNISGVPAQSGGWNISGADVDETNQRLWLVLASRSSHRIVIGYLNLNDTGSGDPPMYAFTPVIDTTAFGTFSVNSFYTGRGQMQVYPAADLIVVSAALTSNVEAASMRVYLISSGNLWKEYGYGLGDTAFPYRGIQYGFRYKDNKIFGSFSYQNSYGQEDFRGLCEIDLTTDLISYHRPDYAEADEYSLMEVVEGEANELVIGSQSYGVAVYDILGGSWTLWSNENIPGMTSDGYDNFWPVAYDPLGKFIMAGTVPAEQGSWRGCVMFSSYGFLRQAHYSIGAYNLGSWSWSAPAALVQDWTDHQAVGVPDPGAPTSMYVFWVSEEFAEASKSIKWDKDGSTFDLTPYICKDAEIALSRSIDGSPYTLSFSISHGHLFDPYNLASAFSMYARKGRKLVVRFGEKVAGTDYWVDAGTFYVTETSLSFERGVYSDLRIKAEDERALWKDRHIYATEAYMSSLGEEWYPEDVLSDLLQDWAGFTPERIDLPVFDNRVAIDHQWTETTLEEIINQLCTRFGYYFRLTNENKASARRISTSAAVDHVYTDKNSIVRYSPDDKYSDFTNRVTVIGAERTFIDVIFPEERVGGLNGTVGWWGYKNDFIVWYSDDRSKRCRNPRLAVAESATSIGFKLAGDITEEITAEDTENYLYCVVTISAPNLIPLLIAALAIAAGGFLIPDGVVTVGAGSSTGFTIPIGRIIEKTGLILALIILCSVGNFQFEVWAQPIGKVRRSVQGSCDDLVGQAETGMVIEKKIDDDLCYSSVECTQVAAQELMIAMAQRKRIAITKTAHLQDEEGDTIQVPHPYSGQAVTVFITNLTRKMKMPESGGAEGYFLDEIEGWICS